MKKDLKSVGKYQYIESKCRRQDKYIEIYEMAHMETGEKILMKKIALSKTTEIERIKHEKLKNQYNILKKVVNPGIVSVPKILKTENSAYFMFSLFDREGEYLDDLMKDGILMKQKDKEQILKGIISVLKFLRNSKIVHFNLSPESIIVNKNLEIKLINFSNSHSWKQETENAVYFPEESPYTAPEMLKNKVRWNSDLYSLGMILKSLRLKSINPENKFLPSSATNLQVVIANLLSEDSSARPTIEEVQNALFSKLTRQSQVEKRKTTNMNDKEPQDEDMRGKGSTSPVSKSIDKLSVSQPYYPENKDQVDLLVKQILKRRNFSIFFMELAEACFSFEQSESEGLFLGSFFLKKSSNIITRLNGFIFNEEGCENQIDLTIFGGSKPNIVRNSDSLKVTSSIRKESVLQNKLLEDIFTKVSEELTGEQQRQLEKIKPKELKNAIHQYLRNAIKAMLENEKLLDKKIMTRFYLMAEGIKTGSFQDYLSSILDEDQLNLHSQKFYELVERMSEEKLLNELRKKIM